ncbi:hypothetical protein RND81_03G168400 [Saponaria officinalis]|uniref:RING-CH-type domain-containing protein n=1 Tax=Saponaria officinalis TaxID=3572 RepID=A0AAW1M8S5_SAPOF
MPTTLPTSQLNDIEQGTITHHRSSGDTNRSSGEKTLENEAAPQKECENRSSTSSSSSLYSCELSESSKVSVNSPKKQRDCRICHVSFDGSNIESGLTIELGCSCKEDLASAHKHCAEVWFKIRGNKTCEICGSTARNVVGVNEADSMEQWNEANDIAPAPAVVPHPAEARHFWQGHKFLNFLLACMVFAFVISWLFHFNVSS